MERNIKDITNFIFISDTLSKSDVIISSGTFRRGVIEKVLEVYNDGFAPYIITTGGVKNDKGVTESESQRKFLIDNGVPESRIFSENRFTNTRENAVFAKEVLDRNDIKYKDIILVSKTYHARRILMTFLANFGDSNIRISSVVDDREITKDNWYLDSEKVRRVLGEVEKIGKYFLKGDLSL